MPQPVKWEASATQGDDPSEYILAFKARIDEGWHVYSQDYDTAAVTKPWPMALYFESTGGFDLIGPTEELGKVKAHREPAFDCIIVKSYVKSVILRQTIRLTGSSDRAPGYFEFQTCNDVGCLPPTSVFFVFENGNIELVDEPDSVNWDNYVRTDYERITAELKDDKPCVPLGGPLEDTASYSHVPVAGNPAQSKGLWGLFLLGLGGGLIALLTPCVFPMIPLTVSFFTKRSTNKRKGFFNALLYACSIVALFVLLGFVITYAFGPEKLNEMAVNKWFNLAFFVIFILFALSFFGAFDINLPSSWVTGVDKVSDRGGLIGIFFMALTLVLVSFSCTAPIVGSVIVLIADSGAFWGPLMGMLGFSLALAIPFALFAAFPAWLNSLPKSGGWMNRVKVTLGFVELALALKFLSVSDLAYNWGILSRDIFIAFWIILSVLLGFYLLGKIRFAHDDDNNRVSIPRLFLAIVSFAFAIYMIPGLWGAPVHLLSGLAPPASHQEFNIHNLDKEFKRLESDIATLSAKVAATDPVEQEIARIESVQLCTETSQMKPANKLKMYFDYSKALRVAQLRNKPLFIDFTGWGCVNCRKMEDKVWSQDAVWDLLNDEYVVVSLYTDDQRDLPDSCSRSPYTGKNVKDIGRLWKDLQRTRYGTISQPYYVLLDNNEQLLNQPRGSVFDASEYAAFLQEGIEEFKRRNGTTITKR